MPRTGRRTVSRATGQALLLLVTVSAPLRSQVGADLDRTRADYAAWLATAPTSPLAAIAQQPIGNGLRLGPPAADIPLEGIPLHRVSQQGGAISLATAGGTRALPRGRPVRLGPYILTADGPPGRAALTVFGPRHAGHPPAYYTRRPALEFVGPLAPPPRPGSVRVLGVDGIEVEAAEAGTVLVPLGDERVRLRVRRLPVSGGEESELEIFFRDGTNGRTTYPAGRFVSLVPDGGARYRLDFNRARNPFCAYSTAYACPAPWPGNAISAPVTAGERYDTDGTGAAVVRPGGTAAE